MTQLNPNIVETKILNPEVSLGERLGAFTTTAKETSNQAKDLLVLEHYIQEEINIRLAKLAQSAMKSASFGYTNSFCTFRDEPLARDINFDLVMHQAIQTGIATRLDASNLSLSRIDGPNIVYTQPPGPEWEYWSEVDYIKTVMEVSW